MIIQEYVTTFRFALRHEQYWAFVRRIQSIKKHIKDLGLTVHVWTAVGFGIAAAAIGDFALKSAEAVDKLGDLGEKLNLSAQEMQEWQYAANLAAIKTGEFEVAIKQFARNIGDAAKGKAPQMLSRFAEIGKKLGKSGKEMVFQDGNVRHWKDVLLDMADAYEKMTGPEKAKQLAISLKLQGRAGEELIQLLNMGSIKIKAMFADARKFGHIITDTEREDADKLIKGWDRFKFALKGAALEIGTNLFPVLEKLTELLMYLTSGIKAVGDAFTKVRDEADKIGFTWRRLIFLINVLLIPAYTQLVFSIGRLIIAQLGLNALYGVTFAMVLRALVAQIASFALALGLAAAKAALFLVVLAGIVLMFDALYVFLTGGDSSISAFSRWLKQIEEARPALAALKEFLLVFFGMMSATNIKNWDNFWTFWARVAVKSINLVTEGMLRLAELAGFMADPLNLTGGRDRIRKFREDFVRYSQQNLPAMTHAMKEVIDPAAAMDTVMRSLGLGGANSSSTDNKFTPGTRGTEQNMSPVTHNIKIDVTAGPGSNPGVIGKAVASEVRSVEEELMSAYPAVR